MRPLVKNVNSNQDQTTTIVTQTVVVTEAKENDSWNPNSNPISTLIPTPRGNTTKEV